MDEIRKVKRVMARADPAAPHETLLVVDANTGQNAVRQVKAFDEALGLTGLVVTKLDGTAKGGAVAAIAREHPCRSASSASARRPRTCARSWPATTSRPSSRDPLLRGRQALSGRP
jgi:hypothetical protein